MTLPFGGVVINPMLAKLGNLPNGGNWSGDEGRE